MDEVREKPRKRSYDPEGMRKRVLDVAAEAFQSAGYHATSMHDVMRAAGATGGALYHHFPTKKALGLAVIEERVKREIEETCIAPVMRAASAAQGILAVFDRTAARLAERGEVAGCPLNNLALELSLIDPAFRAAVEAEFARWRAALADKLRGDKAFAGIDAEGFATFIVAAFSGAMAQAKARQDPAPLIACAHELRRMMPPAPLSPLAGRGSE